MFDSGKGIKNNILFILNKITKIFKLYLQFVVFLVKIFLLLKMYKI